MTIDDKESQNNCLHSATTNTTSSVGNKLVTRGGGHQSGDRYNRQIGEQGTSCSSAELIEHAKLFPSEQRVSLSSSSIAVAQSLPTFSCPTTTSNNNPSSFSSPPAFVASFAKQTFTSSLSLSQQQQQGDHIKFNSNCKRIENRLWNIF